MAEFGQNLHAVGPNELAIANIIALVIGELEQKPVPEAYMGYALYDADSNLYEQGKWIFRSIVRHDSAAKYATHSAGKVASVPLERLPLIPLQSTPL